MMAWPLRRVTENERDFFANLKLITLIYSTIIFKEELTHIHMCITSASEMVTHMSHVLML